MEPKESKVLDQEVIDNLEKIDLAYKQLVMEMGSTEVDILRLTNRKAELVSEFNRMLEEESAYHAQLLEKFGKGSIDIEKKLFIPE